MRGFDLPGFSLQHILFSAVQNADRSLAKRSCPLGLHPDYFNFRIFKEWIKKANRISPPPHTSQKIIRLSLLQIEMLAFGSFADARLKISHHHRIRMGADA